MSALDWLLLALVAFAAILALRARRGSVKRGGCGDCAHCRAGCPKKP